VHGGGVFKLLMAVMAVAIVTLFVGVDITYGC